MSERNGWKDEQKKTQIQIDANLKNIKSYLYIRNPSNRQKRRKKLNGIDSIYIRKRT